MNAPQMVNLTVNNKPVSVKAGTTVIQALENAGVEVPRFCWHPGLSIAGVCRFCMVKIEGMPKLQIACNTTATEGMKVDTVADEVAEAHKWALEFHLINHPLDCPICDQAGECELQNYYMKVGRYDSKMEEDKVLKPKALDVGDTLVLDTERCILCSRCVRFEDEVTKTSTLGIFNRGDRAVIGTFPGRRIQHNYSYNLADVCPVGAFTAKDFRFKCRVWFLKETQSICPGCSTGCNVTLYQNKNAREYYRLKPRHNEAVNGYWMCDVGRGMYEHLNAEARFALPMESGKGTSWASALGALKAEFDSLRIAGKGGDAALVLTPQSTTEEYRALLKASRELLGAQPQVYVWRPAGEKRDAFDGILYRGDHNPNTKGLEKALAEHGVQATELSGSFAALKAKQPAFTLVAGPEIEKSYPNYAAELASLRGLGKVAYLGSNRGAIAGGGFWLNLPTKVFAEKSGSYTNHAGVEQELIGNPPVYVGVRDAIEIMEQLAIAKLPA